MRDARPTNRGPGVAVGDDSADVGVPGTTKTTTSKAKTRAPSTRLPSSNGKTKTLPPSPLQSRARDVQRRDALVVSSDHFAHSSHLRDRGETDAVAHLRQGTDRWFVTTRDETKTVAWWQLTCTRETRRADIADERFKQVFEEAEVLRRSLETEHANRFRFEELLKGAFDQPTVRDALRAFPEDADTRHENDGSTVAAKVFRALELRINSDASQLEAAKERELYLANKLQESETQKFGAFAAAHKAREELKAHVTRLRIDNEIRREAQTRLEKNDADARELPVLKAQLSDARSQLVELKENDEKRVEIQAAAIKDAVKLALKTRHDDSYAENIKLREALKVQRTKLGERDWEHARAFESKERERVAALEGVRTNANQLAEKLRVQILETRHADVERARVAEEAGKAVERAISQREWALEVLDREIEAQEGFGKKLSHEFYTASLHAMPETAVSTEDEKNVAGLARRVAEEFTVERERIREIMAKLHSNIEAITHIREAAKAAGVVAGWNAALKVATQTTKKAGPKEWPATNRLREKIVKGREDARMTASRGAARRNVLKALGRDIEPLDLKDGVRTIERLMMPTEPSVKKVYDPKEYSRNVGAQEYSENVTAQSPGGGDYFYDAETPTTVKYESSTEDEKNVAGLARRVAEEFTVERERIREIMAKLHSNIEAITHIREAAKAAGVVAGWNAALKVATQTTKKAGPKEWPATNRLREKIVKGREDARMTASRGAARRNVLKALGRDIEPLDLKDGVRTIERLMMPTEPSVKKVYDPKEYSRNVGAQEYSENVTAQSPGGGDYFYDAETPTTVKYESSTGTHRDTDCFYDVDVSTPPVEKVTPKRGHKTPATRLTPYLTPGEPRDDTKTSPASNQKAEFEEGWIEKAREQAVKSLLRRVQKQSATHQSTWGELLDQSPMEQSPKTPTDKKTKESTLKRLSFVTPPETKRKEEPFHTPSASWSGKKQYTPSSAARVEIEKLAKSLRL